VTRRVSSLYPVLYGREVLSGAGAEARGAMLDKYDALLTMPTAGELDQLIEDDPGRGLPSSTFQLNLSRF